MSIQIGDRVNLTVLNETAEAPDRFVEGKVIEIKSEPFRKYGRLLTVQAEDNQTYKGWERLALKEPLVVSEQEIQHLFEQHGVQFVNRSYGKATTKTVTLDCLAKVVQLIIKNTL